MNVIMQVMVLALFIDRLLGEPLESFHPTAWIGRLITAMDKRSDDSHLQGALLFAAVVLPASFAAFIIVDALGVGRLIGIVVASLVLKLQFSWRSLGEHAQTVARGLENSLDEARMAVSRIVGRDTSKLDEEHVISAAVESVGESSVDGIIAPLFYYVTIGGFFGVALGVAAAAFYRAVNTLDSMVGYKKEGYFRLGFVSARADDLLNYLPARITAILIVFSSLLTRDDTSGALRVLMKDRKKTVSPNSGHPMSAVAGAFGIRLEKIGHHVLGDAKNQLNLGHIARATRLVDMTVMSFLVLSFIVFNHFKEVIR